MIHDFIKDLLIVFFFLLVVVSSSQLFHYPRLLIFLVNTLGFFIEGFSLLFDFIKNQLIVLADFLLEVLSVLKSLVDLLIEDSFILDFFIAVLQKFL